MDTSEKRFEQDIETSLLSNGYVQFSKQGPTGTWEYAREYDAEKALYLDVLVEFISKTQPKEWAKYTHLYGEQAANKLYMRFETEVNNHGLIYVLRNGIQDLGIKLKVCYFQPESELNEKANELYEQNIISVTRQFAYSTKNHNTIDMALCVNGIPVVALELKNQLKGQDYECAIRQFREDRDPKELCFRLNHRFLVYFAVDLYETWMTTHLNGTSTRFMPFNQGSGGAGNVGGAGNPENPDGYCTSYLWEEVLAKDSLMDILHRFVSYVETKEDDKVNKYLIFPRYHQYDVTHKILADVKKNGAGHNYLIEHSAGSGKSNSIAWIAYRLASLFDDDNKPVFNSVIVVTNRVVLDSQLQDTINSFEHKPGLVEPIDEKKRSKGLSEAINDKKRIIICTIQKFLFAYKDFDSLDGRKFAIIIDEAHQGQSGESAKTLRKALVDKKVAIKEYSEEEMSSEVLDVEDVLEEILSQGKHKNQSFFAFTATPKNKTLETFGTYHPETNKFLPFHIYSMRQAIEEGFILDVLSNYTTVKEAFKIVKTSEDNPELIEGQASKVLFRYYKEHGFTISQKTEMIMSNFLNSGRFKINCKGKCMVVADSRANAIRYFWAIQDYIKDHPQEAKGCGVLVAFSGTVKFDDDEKEYTEATLNIDADGNSINTDKKFRKAFRSDKYNILVVADKYQTGFDEPLLHSMYVDKRLRGVNAVQTLSRLNRTCRGKDDTFVLDFENKDEDIKSYFQPYYETAVLEGSTDCNQVYDLRAKIGLYMLYNFDDVKKVTDLMAAQSGKKQDSVAMGKLTSLLKPVVERYNDLNDEERYAVRGYIKKFNKAYSYITQLVRLHDVDLFNEYVFLCQLIQLLPKDPKKKVNIDDKIRLEFASLKETFSGAITLDKQEVVMKPGNSIGESRKHEKKDTLQNIIEKVNERYSGDFSDSDKVIIEGIFNMFMTDDEIKKYKKLAKDSNPEMFIKSLFPQKFQEIVTRCFMENNDSFQKLFNDPEFYNQVMEQMAKALYKELRK